MPHFDFPFHPFGLFFPLLLAVIAWTLVIKGLALWKAARNNHRAWFVILLIVNTIGILELVYLIWFAKRDLPVAESSAPEVQ